MRLFDSEGPIMEVLGKLADIIFINFTFVILSLPIITMGASLCAMYECCFSLIEDTEDVFVPRQFFRSFVKNLKRGTGAWVISLVIIAFLGAYAWVIRYFDGALGQTYRITFFVLVFLFGFGCQYVWALISKTNMSIIKVWGYAWKLAVVALPWSLLNLVVVVGLSVVFTLLLPANSAVYLWAFLFFGLITHFSSLVIRKVFQKFGVN